MYRPQCFCCKSYDGIHDSVEVKHGVTKGFHALCSACMKEVSRVMAEKVQKGHLYELLPNAIAQVEGVIARRRSMVILAPMPCRLDRPFLPT